MNNFGKIRGLLELTTVTLLFLLAAVTVNAQQISGTPGSPSATTTIDGPCPDIFVFRRALPA